MKKTMKTGLMLVLVISMVACLVGCGNKGPSGRYELASIEAEGITMDVETLKSMAGEEGEDFEMYIEFDRDGTGTVVLMNEKVSMTWDEKDITAEDEEPVPYKLNGREVTITADGVTMTFKK